MIFCLGGILLAKVGFSQNKYLQVSERLQTKYGVERDCLQVVKLAEILL